MVITSDEPLVVAVFGREVAVDRSCAVAVERAGTERDADSETLAEADAETLAEAAIEAASDSEDEECTFFGSLLAAFEAGDDRNKPSNAPWANMTTPATTRTTAHTAIITIAHGYGRFSGAKDDSSSGGSVAGRGP
jgi:hypothetical protein